MNPVNAIYARLPTMECKGLCQSACTVILMAPCEERRLRKRVVTYSMRQELLTAARDMKAGKDVPACSLLKDGRCSVYAIRPAICRLWGLVKRMACPYGCTPDKYLSDEEAHAILDQLNTL